MTSTHGECGGCLERTTSWHGRERSDIPSIVAYHYAAAANLQHIEIGGNGWIPVAAWESRLHFLATRFWPIGSIADISQSVARRWVASGVFLRCWIE
jgi:hypothetical protein